MGRFYDTLNEHTRILSLIKSQINADTSFLGLWNTQLS